MLKAIKWIGITVLMAMLTVIAINGSLGDEKADGNYLYIVQSELERSSSGLKEVADDRELLPVIDAELTKQADLTGTTTASTRYVPIARWSVITVRGGR